MKIEVYRPSCFGCGLCVDSCPTVFQIGSEGKVGIGRMPVEAWEREQCREAERNCPTSVITVSD